MGENNEFLYEPGDLVFVHKLDLVEKVIDRKDEIYDARVHDNVETVHDLMLRAESVAERLELGVIVEVTDDEVVYSPRKIVNNRDFTSTKQRVRFKSLIEPEEKTVSMQDLRDRKMAIHGVDMTSEYEKLYALVDMVNPPRNRDVYYTREGEQAYLKLTTPENDLKINHVQMDKLDVKVLRDMRKDEIKMHPITSNL